MSFTVRNLPEEDAEILDRAFGVKGAMMEFNPGRCVMPPFFTDIAQQILDAPVRVDDIWLLSFPRTGSTWCQEMIWLLGNNLDFDGARKTIQQIRAPLIEMSTVLAEFYDSTTMASIGNSVEYINNLQSPRYIKSHLPIQLLPIEWEKVKPKSIYVCRNPKDMCVSYYHHCRLLHHMNVTFEEFCKLMLRDATPMGSVFTNYLGYWNKRHEPNFLFLKYEDMKKDVRGTVEKIADFLGKHYSDEQYDTLCDFLSFEKMRENKGCNLQPLMDGKMGNVHYKDSGKNFIRKGVVGDWKNHMSPEMSEKFDKWIEENTRGTGLSFDME